MNFNVGEKVRVRKDLKEEKMCGKHFVTKSMVKYKGRILTIENVSRRGAYILKECGRMMFWNDEMLEPVGIKNCDNCKYFDTYFDCGQCEDFDEWAKTEEKENLTNHPKHYAQGKYEVIDIIMESVKDLPPKQAVCVGHIIRYIMQYHYKNGLQDVQECEFYIKKLISLMEGSNEN